VRSISQVTQRIVAVGRRREVPKECRIVVATDATPNAEPGAQLDGA
jgi:hypothetical protein